MKYLLSLLAGATIIGMAACSSGTDNSFYKSADVKPGQIMDSLGAETSTDAEHKGVFSVVVIADNYVADGVYDVRAHFADFSVDGKFTMPKGLLSYKLKLRKTNVPTKYQIGFMLPNDTTYYDYLDVVASNGRVESIGYCKTYTF